MKCKSKMVPPKQLNETLVVTPASVCKILIQNIKEKYREAAGAPAEMPSSSQSPSLHECRFATLSFCPKFWQTGFSWFHHPVWKHGIKRWWCNHLTLNVCARLLQPDGDGLSRVKQAVMYVSPGQQMIQQMVQMSDGSPPPHQRRHLRGCCCY